jgi:hypothetical protein
VIRKGGICSLQSIAMAHDFSSRVLKNNGSALDFLVR